MIEKVSATMRAPYILQTAVTLEQQLPANTTLAMTYTNSHGVHNFRSNDINAPLPGSEKASLLVPQRRHRVDP